MSVNTRNVETFGVSGYRYSTGSGSGSGYRYYNGAMNSSNGGATYASGQVQQQQRWPQQQYNYWQPLPEPPHPQHVQQIIQHQSQQNTQFQPNVSQVQRSPPSPTSYQWVPVPFGEKRAFQHGQFTPDPNVETVIDWRNNFNLMRYTPDEFKDSIRNRKDVKRLAELLDHYYAQDINDVISFMKEFVELTNRCLGLVAYQDYYSQGQKEKIKKLRLMAEGYKADAENIRHMVSKNPNREKELEQKLAEANKVILALKLEKNEIIKRTKKTFMPWHIQAVALTKACREFNESMKAYIDADGFIEEKQPERKALVLKKPEE